MSIESILADRGAKKLLATALSTAEIRELPADVRAASLWSARTNHLGYMAKVARKIDALLAGEITRAQARAELKEELDMLGYDPETGFAEPDTEEPVPPAARGSMRDLSSSARINLMLGTNEDIFYGRGQKEAGAARADTWPAWELIRVRSSLVPRDWPARWKEAADSVAWQGVARGTDRAIALKSSPIWAAIGDSKIFRDALDTDCPPFAFGSGMGWRELRASEVAGIEFGGPADNSKAEATPDKRPLNDDLAASVKNVPTDLVEAARKHLAAELDGDKLRYRQAMDANREEYLRRGVSAEALAERDRRIAEVAAKNRIAAALDLIRNRGTSDGARKGWITRRRGGAGGKAARERRTRKAVSAAHAEIAKVMRQKGKFEGSMRVPGTGDVRLTYGTGGHWGPDASGITHTDGHGLKKIREKHGPKALRDIPEVLLRGKSTPWRVAPGGYAKKDFFHDGLRVVLSRKKSGPIVLTSFDPSSPEIKKSDLKRRHENKMPASLAVNRHYEEGGNGGANPGPTRAGLVYSLPGAGASKAATIAREHVEVKAA